MKDFEAAELEVPIIVKQNEPAPKKTRLRLLPINQYGTRMTLIDAKKKREDKNQFK